MALSRATIFIGKKEIKTFISVELFQRLASHHHLELVCRADAFDEELDELANMSKNFINEVINLEISSSPKLKEYGVLRFQGIVTEIKAIKGDNLSGGNIVKIIAKSPTFLTDTGINYTSYNDVALPEIISNNFEGYDRSKLTLDIQPQNNLVLQYSVQHKESDFEYASRLAAQYGEWFYYTGTKLIFGTPENNEVKLKYRFDLKKYEIHLAPKAQNSTYFAEDYFTNELHQTKTENINTGIGSYNGFLSNKAASIYVKESRNFHRPFMDENMHYRLDANVELQKKADEIKQAKVTGVSDNMGVSLGGIIIINGTKYRVTYVKHKSHSNGDYLNNFEAISTDSNAYPLTDIHAFPKSDIQSAIVIENNDPEGLGRVKVAFSWQSDVEQTTPWLRMITPHAGNDKGFHFIPELNEEVLIGFEGGNAERPYVIGSLYNGNQNAKTFNSKTNDFKMIRTRSGHTIELNDTDGEEKINIYDNQGSIITFNTQEKSLIITAKNINITAEENTTVGAKKNIEILAEENVTALAKQDLQLQSTGDTAVKSTGTIAIEATKDATLLGMNTTVEGKTSTEINGTKTKVTGSTMTEISGAMVKIN